MANVQETLLVLPRINLVSTFSPFHLGAAAALVGCCTITLLLSAGGRRQMIPFHNLRTATIV